MPVPSVTGRHRRGHRACPVSRAILALGEAVRAKYTITEARDATGKQTGWVLVTFDDFKDDDLYTTPSKTDRYFGTYDEAPGVEGPDQRSCRGRLKQAFGLPVHRD